MASIAMRGTSATRPVSPVQARGSVSRSDDFAAVIMSARLAKIVRQLQFAAIRAFLKRGRGQRVVAATHIPTRRRGFSLRDGHFGTLFIE
jgi:hypothetical protein